jgi:hypothetical protein
MKATEFRKEQEFKYDYFSELTKTGIAPNYENIDKFAEAYHQYELKKLRLVAVSGRSEQFSCPFPETKGCDRHKIDDEEGRWEFCNTCKREWAR